MACCMFQRAQTWYIRLIAKCSLQSHEWVHACTKYLSTYVHGLTSHTGSLSLPSTCATARRLTEHTCMIST